jgi:hypothetical protein
MRAHYAEVAAGVIGRRLFDLTNGWDGKPAAGEHVFVVTHEPPTNWEHADTTPFTFVDNVESAIGAAREYAGDRLVDVSGGQMGNASGDREAPARERDGSYTLECVEGAFSEDRLAT